MQIDSTLVKHLGADEVLKALVGDNILPLAIPEGGKIPAIVWQRISSPRTLSLDGDSVDNPRFQFSVYDFDLPKAREIARALNNALDKFSGTLDGVKTQILRADYRDSYEHETGLYRSDVDFFILYTKKG